jgi:predicted exporter
MYYHYRSGKWKVVDKTPAQITEQKKSLAANAAKIAAAALIAQAVATPAPVAGMTAALPLPAAAPIQDKLKAANLAKQVMEQLSLAMKAELDNP